MDFTLAANGLRFRCHEQGHGPSLVLVHGVGATLESWDAVAAILETNFKILRYDLRGHGRSEKPAPPYSIAGFTDDLAGLLDTRGISATHVVGFSLGGLIAQDFAIRYPRRLQKLIILSAIAGRSPEEKTALKKRAEKLESGGAGATLDAALERWFTPEFRAANPALIEERMRQARRNDPVSYAAAYRAFVETDLGGELHRIQSATLVATGEHDPGSSARMATFMHEQITGSKLRILPRLRHSILVEAPQQVADLISEFLCED